MVWWLLQAALAADPTSVVAAGDAMLAPEAAPTGGWVAVLADCLEERAAGRYAVVDRAKAGATPAQVREQMPDILGQRPKIVVVGLAAPAQTDKDTVASFEVAVLGLARDLTAGGADVVLLGVVEDGASTVAWGDIVQRAVSSVPKVAHVRLGSDWPADPAARSALISRHVVTDQGHARIGAAACDAVTGAVRAP